MKTLALIVRRPDLTRDEFRAHYEDTHAPLAIDTVLEGVTRYLRHHLDAVREGEVGFDVATSFWYRDVAAALAVQARLETPQGEAILRDETTFMDRAANTFFAVTERPVLGDATAGAHRCFLALARHGNDSARDEFLAYHERELLPALCDSAKPRFVLDNIAIAAGGGPPAFDVVTELRVEAEEIEGAASWLEAVQSRGGSGAVVRVTPHESELPR